MNRREILDEIHRLNLPADAYVIVGGAAMAVRGIRETEDIDLVVTPSLFAELESSGWRPKQRPNGKPGLRKGRLEAYLDVNTEAFHRSTPWLLEHAETVEGVPLVDLETLASFKASYGRAKDVTDLALLETHRHGPDTRGDAMAFAGLRKQYHFRPSERGYRAWGVDRLVRLAGELPTQEVALTDIAEIDEPYWFDTSGDRATCRQIAEHARLIEEADLGVPIILSSDGRVMDGMHRVIKALNAGLATIDAVRFEDDPEPDYVDVLPVDLPY